MNGAETWLVVKGDDTRNRITTHQRHPRTLDALTGRELHQTVVFIIPEEFRRAWRENRP